MAEQSAGQGDEFEALSALGDRVEGLVTGAIAGDEGAWDAPTPAAGWTVAHQVAHLAWTDDVSLTAIRDADAFAAILEGAMADPTGFVDAGAEQWAARGRAELLQTWHDGRLALARELAAADPAEPLPWFGPPMRPKTMATARVMETWAHGQDVADAVGVDVSGDPAFTAAMPHVAKIGHRTRDFAFMMNSLEPPAEPVRVVLEGPDGSVIDLGPAEAAQVVTGSLRDFCLLVTQRVHRADTDLTTDAEDAEAWLKLAQAYAGLPGGGREEGSRR